MHFRGNISSPSLDNTEHTQIILTTGVEKQEKAKMMG
jgi:hypothetical protein